MPETGEQLGHYRIVSKIGAGGMGEVYLAEDTKLDRKIALKILPPEFAEDKDRMNRFVREAKSASALNHPNIITIYEIGESDKTHFIATEFIDGETLSEYAKANPLDFESALEIAIQIASALDEAHAAGIVHRDIKPDNLMIRASGLVKILDFGIAKLSTPLEFDGEAATVIKGTSPGMIIGTANYMSPEQAAGKTVDARSDIFSLGVVLYEMIAGKLPFEGETAMEMIGAILKDEPPPLGAGVPDELKRIVGKCLRKDLRERYQTIKDVCADLKEFKRELEFQDKLGRTGAPNRAEQKTQILKAATTAEENPRSAIHDLKSVVVLPFTNIGADAENEYFCDGLAEGLLNALSKIEDLRVAARTSAFSFKGKNAEAREIGKKLSVKNILEGSVRRSGDKLRITVQLVNAADGYQLWSERYDREMRDIFDVQDEITLAVVDALKIKLLGDEKEAILKRYTSNAEAYQLYLRGRFFFFKRTAEGFRKALEYFERAIEIDADYAVAYSGLADCYTFLGFYEEMPPAEAAKNLKPFANQALELDATLAETHASLAICKSLYDWNYKAADEEYKKALALNPKNAFAHHLDSANLILLGLQQEAITAEKRAVELEPFTAVFNATLGWWYHVSRRADEAILQSLKTIEIAPNHFFPRWVLGLAYGQTGKFFEAVPSLEKALSLTGGNQHIKGDLGRIYAESGRREEALKILSEFAEEAKEKYVSAVNLAKIYLGLGEHEQMFQQLENAVEERAVRLPFFLIDPAVDGFRLESRFQKILRRVGLPFDENAPGQITNESPEAQTVMFSSGELKSEQSDDLEAQSAGSSLNSEQTTNPAPEIRNPKSKWWLFGLLGLLVLVGGFFGYGYFTAAKQIESIAVMPFTNESGNADIEYLSDGMTETLISSLSNLPNLNVKPRSSVFRYKGKETDPQTIAKELNVQAILNGRVVQRGQDISLFVELIDISLDKVVWSETYNRKQTDLVALQADIARDVSGKIKNKLSGEDIAKVTKTYTTNPEAYQLYLKGNFYLTKYNEEGYRKGIEYYEKAIASDPNYALAYHGIAAAYDFANGYYLSAKESEPKAKAAAVRALEIG